MGKPSIGDAVTAAGGIKKEREVHELTVLGEDSKDSIYNLIFVRAEEGGMTSDE